MALANLFGITVCEILVLQVSEINESHGSKSTSTSRASKLMVNFLGKGREYFVEVSRQQVTMKIRKLNTRGADGRIEK